MEGKLGERRFEDTRFWWIGIAMGKGALSVAPCPEQDGGVQGGLGKVGHYSEGEGGRKETHKVNYVNVN